MEWKDLREELLKDPEFRKAYERPDPIYWLQTKWIDFKIWLRRFKK